MKEVWATKDEYWVWYDAKPVADILGQDIRPYQVPIQLTDDEYEAYRKHIEEQAKWQDFFEQKAREVK